MSHRWGENTCKQTPERESFSNLTTGRIPHRKQGKIPKPDTVQEDPWVASAEHTKRHPTWRDLPDQTASVAEASEMATREDVVSWALRRGVHPGRQFGSYSSEPPRLGSTQDRRTAVPHKPRSQVSFSSEQMDTTHRDSEAFDMPVGRHGTQPTVRDRGWEA